MSDIENAPAGYRLAGDFADWVRAIREEVWQEGNEAPQGAENPWTKKAVKQRHQQKYNNKEAR